MALLFSCQTTQNQAIKKVETLSVDYYTIKTPEKNDLEYLNKFIKDNSSFRDDALILKAGYFIKNKDFTNAYKIFKDYPGLTTSNETLKKYLYEWRIKSFLENKEKPLDFDISNINEVDLRLLCSNLSYKNILDEKCNENERAEDNNTVMIQDNVSYEQDNTTVISDNETVKIYVPPNRIDDNLTRGMIFAINENNVDVEILSNKSDDTDKIKLNFNELMLSIDNVSYFFGFDFNDNFYEVLSIIWSSDPELVVIGVGNKKYIDVDRLKTEIEDLGINCIIVNYLEKNIQARLETINDEYGENSIFYLGIGTEEDLIKFIPIVKFTSKHFDKNEIAVLTDSITEKFFKKEIKQYFYNIQVITYIEALQNYWSKKFENLYKGFYGFEPDSNAFIGYDMILKLFNMDKVFVSNIESFENLKAGRKLKYFRILSYNQVEQLNIPNYFN